MVHSGRVRRIDALEPAHRTIHTNEHEYSRFGGSLHNAIQKIAQTHQAGSACRPCDARDRGQELEDEQTQVLQRPITLPYPLLSPGAFLLLRRKTWRRVVERDVEPPSQGGMTSFLTLERSLGRQYAFLPIVPTSLTPLSFCKRSSLESHTKPLYALELKSNGCVPQLTNHIQNSPETSTLFTRIPTLRPMQRRRLPCLVIGS
jgi:hypothetical protein